MSSPGTEKKRAAPVKVLSSQLRTAESCGDSFVVRPRRGRSLAVSPVWMQGTVLEVRPDRDSLLLMDETGTFTVQGVKSVPKGKPCLSEGTETSTRAVLVNVALITESWGTLSGQGPSAVGSCCGTSPPERCANAYSTGATAPLLGWRF